MIVHKILIDSEIHKSHANVCLAIETIIKNVIRSKESQHCRNKPTLSPPTPHSASLSRLGTYIGRERCDVWEDNVRHVEIDWIFVVGAYSNINCPKGPIHLIDAVCEKV